jgi:hypothetical protein
LACSFGIIRHSGRPAHYCQSISANQLFIYPHYIKAFGILQLGASLLVRQIFAAKMKDSHFYHFSDFYIFCLAANDDVIDEVVDRCFCAAFVLLSVVYQSFRVHKSKIDLSKFPRERIRNFSIVAHIDHGKTTLSDRLLRMAGWLKLTSTKYLFNYIVQEPLVRSEKARRGRASMR